MTTFSSRRASGRNIGRIRQGALDSVREPRQFEGFGEELVDPSFAAGVAIIALRIGGQRDDRDPRRSILALESANRARRFVAVEARHLDVHQDEVEPRRRAANCGAGSHPWRPSLKLFIYV